MNKTIVWFRQDLRLRDNAALCYGAGQGTIIPLYIYDQHDNSSWALGAASKWWLHHSLRALSKDLEIMGAPLILRSGNPLDALISLIQETGATAVCWNRCYEPIAIERDEVIKDCLNQEGIRTHDFSGALLKEPWEIMNGEGNAYRVFTPFWKNLSHHYVAPPPLEIPNIVGETGITSDSLDGWALLPKTPWDSTMKTIWEPGEKGALNRLESFHSKLSFYAHDRDFPEIQGTSCLSPHLHFGEISPNSIWYKFGGIEKPDVEPFLRQLGWRDFSAYLLYHYSQLPEYPFVNKFKDFPWDSNQENFSAWTKGETGYPIIDAGMRELWQTGYMHNRVRMIVASFLTKHLLLPWQWGERWFWDTLVDADLANNAASWQWVAGCGADAAPYYRIFNPILQGQKFDPDGTYVRKWVPELMNLDVKYIHTPWIADATSLKLAGVVLGKNYPFPLVDHQQARTRALDIYKKL